LNKLVLVLKWRMWS